MSRSARVALVLALVLAHAACGGDRDPADEGAPHDVVVEKNVPATMRDGVVLRADIYRPEASGAFPALLRRTPYA